MKQYSMRNPQWMNWPSAALGGIALGAMAMYLADPAQGKRRRLQAQEKMRAASRQTGDVLSRMMRETDNRLSAAQIRAKAMLKKESLDDEALQARAQSMIAKLASFPEKIGIKAEQGHITLSGTVMPKEKDRLLRKLRRIPGISELHDHLKTADRTRAWSLRKERGQKASAEPGKAAAYGVKSAGNAMRNASRHIPIGALLAVAGLGYAIQRLGKGMQRRSEIHGAARPQKEIHLQKTVEIQASPETVFNIWSKYDNFPQFMPRLLDIQSIDMERSHWVMKGPAGVNLEWDTALTKYMEPTMLAWKTEADAPIEHNGSVRFESSNGGTRATVRMFYGPATGSSSDNLAALLGNDPEQELEEGLERMKNFIEGRSFPREVPQVDSSSGQVLH